MTTYYTIVDKLKTEMRKGDAVHWNMSLCIVHWTRLDIGL